MSKAGIYINVGLMVLNLIPILPLDGGRIAVSLLPHRLAYSYSKLEPYGLILIMVLLFTNILTLVITPLTHLVINLLAILFGL